MKYDFKEWLHFAGVRALKTVAETALGLVGSAAILGEVDWTLVASASAMAGVISLLISIKGLPELDLKKENKSE